MVQDDPLIDLANVSKRYGDKLAVDRLSLQVPAGELFAFLGPNGAGKTTTIKMMTGLLRATEGVVRICGHDMAENGEVARANISYVPDQPYLYEKLTGRELLAFVRDIHGLSGPDVESTEARLVETFEMRAFYDQLVESYSHGMRQRLAFAAALLHGPRVLVVDEPMVGLDPKSMRIVKDLFRQTADAGAAVFMSTHTLAIAEEMADRIGIIHHGRLIRCGAVDELKKGLDRNATLEDLFLEVTSGSAA